MGCGSGKNDAIMSLASSQYRQVIALAAAVLLIAGRPPASAASKDAPHVRSFEELERANWLRRRLSPCPMIIDSMRQQTGQEAITCSENRTNLEAIACANDAFHRKKPFVLCDSGWGMDSHFENGVAGLPTGNILVYYLDTFGPRY